MTPRSYKKGVSYEREVAALWESFPGWQVRGLESGGDHIVTGHGLVIAQETKRGERVKLPEWWEQTVRDSNGVGVPVLTFRPSRMRSRSILWTDDLIAMVSRD